MVTTSLYALRLDSDLPRFREHVVTRLPPSLHTRLGSDSRGLSADAFDRRTPPCLRAHYVLRLYHSSHLYRGVCEIGGESKALRSRTSLARHQLRTTPV